MCDKLPVLDADLIIAVADRALVDPNQFVIDVGAKIDRDNPALSKFLLNYLNDSKTPDIAQGAITIFLVIYETMLEQIKLDQESVM